MTDAVVGEIAAAATARAAAPDYPAAYVERARAAAARLGAVDVGEDDVRGALLLLEQQVDIDPVVPVVSPRRPVTMVKSALRRLMLWYVRYVADQVTVAGHAATRLGAALAARVERLEATAADDRRRSDEALADLDARVRRLEQGRGA